MLCVAIAPVTQVVANTDNLSALNSPALTARVIECPVFHIVTRTFQCVRYVTVHHEAAVCVCVECVHWCIF